MDRPQSIIWFERLYLGGAAVSLANTLINWSSIQEQVAATPNSELLPSWFTGAMIAIGISVNLLLWYFVARRGSIIAKWIVSVLFALGLIGVLRTLGSDMAVQGTGLFAITVVALHGAAVFMLFRPDAKAWFGGGTSTS